MATLLELGILCGSPQQFCGCAVVAGLEEGTWVIDLERGARLRLTPDEQSRRPIWTRDGAPVSTAGGQTPVWSRDGKEPIDR